MEFLMFKSQLQEYAQKAGLTAPVYEITREGPSHEPQFKATVTLQGETYESPSVYTNLKKAEHAAAEVALLALAKNSDIGTSLPGPLHESGLCKNLLQEYAQKCKLSLPIYRSDRSGEIHSPLFNSTVEIGGVHYKGGVAKSKKEAEIKAAKTAMIAILSDTRGASLLQASGSQLGQGSSPEAAMATLIKSYSNPRGKKRSRGPRAFPRERRKRKAKTDCQPIGKQEVSTAEDLPNEITKPELQQVGNHVDSQSSFAAQVDPSEQVSGPPLTQVTKAVETPESSIQNPQVSRAVETPESAIQTSQLSHAETPAFTQVVTAVETPGCAEVVPVVDTPGSGLSTNCSTQELQPLCAEAPGFTQVVMAVEAPVSVLIANCTQDPKPSPAETPGI